MLDDGAEESGGELPRRVPCRSVDPDRISHEIRIQLEGGPLLHTETMGDLRGMSSLTA